MALDRWWPMKPLTPRIRIFFIYSLALRGGGGLYHRRSRRTMSRLPDRGPAFLPLAEIRFLSLELSGRLKKRPDRAAPRRVPGCGFPARSSTSRCARLRVSVRRNSCLSKDPGDAARFFLRENSSLNGEAAFPPHPSPS